MNKIVVSILISVVVIVGAIFMSQSGESKGGSGGSAEAVYVEEGKQVIEINARGGYFPRVVKAEAGVESVVRMRTKNTYDCSIALTIPDIGYSGFLPTNGVTDILIPSGEPGGKLIGSCSMGMYFFEINFE